MPIWDQKTKELEAEFANARAEAMYRNALTASNPPISTSTGIQPGGMTLGVSSVDLARRISSFPTKPPTNDITYPDNRKSMIAMRLRLTDGMKWPFDFLETHHQDDKVLVFVVANRQPVILEDEAGLFPSDALITQLRLIQA